MMPLIITVVVVFILLMVSELWWRNRPVHDEFSRKFVHITVGSFVAFWPFFLSWNTIRLLSLAFLIVVGISRYLHLFKAIHSVQRPTWGEVFFALAVGLTTYLTHDKWVYMASLLQMSLADGLAAVVGLRYGRRQTYSMFGFDKSVIGTLTFFVVSLGILLAYVHFAAVTMGAGTLLFIAFGASMLENLAVHGLDNLLIPLLTAWALLVFRQGGL